VVAFAGTNPTQIPDWLANFGQGLGLETQQYEQARELGQLMDAAFGDNVIFTGHSLGGGLASLAALETGNAAVTFNAAGLHDTTIRSTGLDPECGRHQAAEGQIRAYRVDGDLLTAIQENGRLASIAPDAVGHPIELGDPHGFWDHVLNPIRWWDVSHGVELHLMGSVLDALQQDQPWQ